MTQDWRRFGQRRAGDLLDHCRQVARWNIDEEFGRRARGDFGFRRLKWIIAHLGSGGFTVNLRPRSRGGKLKFKVDLLHRCLPRLAKAGQRHRIADRRSRRDRSLHRPLEERAPGAMMRRDLHALAFAALASAASPSSHAPSFSRTRRRSWNCRRVLRWPTLRKAIFRLRKRP